MFSAILGFIESLLKMAKNAQHKHTKKETDKAEKKLNKKKIKKEEKLQREAEQQADKEREENSSEIDDVAEEKPNDKIDISDDGTSDADSAIEDYIEPNLSELSEEDKINSKNDAKKEVKVLKSKLIEKLLLVKIIVIKVLKWIVRIIETVISMILSVLGITGLVAVICGVAILIIMIGFLHSDQIVVNDGNSTMINDNHYGSQCIQGLEVISNNQNGIQDISQLQATYTERQQNIYRLYSIYLDILNRPLDTVFTRPGVIQECINVLGVDRVAQAFMGFSSIETGFNMPGSDNILENPVTTKINSLGYGFLGLCGANTFNGYYFYKASAAPGNHVLVDSFVEEYKSKYKPITTPAYDYAYVPYAVAAQLGSVTYSYLLSSNDYIDTHLDAVMDAYGIQNNRDKLKAYIKIFAAAEAYHGHVSNSKDGLLSLWVATWSATSENDASRSFENISFLNEPTKKYKDGYGYFDNDENFYEKTGFFTVNGVVIDEPLWIWVSHHCSNTTYFNETVTERFLKGSTDLTLNARYGIYGFFVGKKAVEDLGISAPIAVGGGSIYDCDCVYSPISVSSSVTGIDLSKITIGVAQGPWSADTKSFIEQAGRETGAIEYFGRAKAIDEKDSNVSSLGMTYEAWRQQTKWKIPYYEQPKSPENGNGTVDKYTSSLKGSSGSSLGLGCHIYMFSYMASALTQTIINPAEMTLALHHLGGINGTGLEVPGSSYKVFTDLGLKAINIKGDSKYGNVSDFLSGLPTITESDLNTLDKASMQKVVDAVLNANGVVGFAGHHMFTKNENHYVVISEKVGDKYRVVFYESYREKFSDTDTFDLFSFDYIYEATCTHASPGYNHRFYLAYNPNMGSNGSVQQSTSGVNCISNNGPIIVGKYEETPGKFQGPWGDLTSYVEKISEDPSLDFVGQSYKQTIEDRTKALLPYVGTKPAMEGSNLYSYEQDIWKQKNGYGFVRYRQGGGYEAWTDMRYGDSTFSASACGLFSVSSALSTLMGRYLNPPEVIIAINTYPLWSGKSREGTNHMDGNSTGAMNYGNLALIAEECGFNAKRKSSPLTQDEVDDALSKGGLVIFVSSSALNNRYTSGAHYVVIREKYEGCYLIYSSTHWTNSKVGTNCKNTWEDIHTLNTNGQTVIITPK